MSMMTCERTHGFTCFGTVSRSVNGPVRVMTTAFRRSQLSMAADIISPFDAASTSTLDDLVRQKSSICIDIQTTVNDGRTENLFFLS